MVLIVFDNKVIRFIVQKLSSAKNIAMPIDSHHIMQRVDTSHGMNRVEVRSQEADSHLGTCLRTGRERRAVLRYCINSSAVRFIPKEDLEQAGYGGYLYLFVEE